MVRYVLEYLELFVKKQSWDTNKQGFFITATLWQAFLDIFIMQRGFLFTAVLFLVGCRDSTFFT